MGNSFDQGRLHALDNLRALLMWLGIVLHVGINHLSGMTLLPFRDTATTPAADLVVFFIHAFRMPAFFMLAGLLVAMMVAQRGPAAMLKNRVRRIALPFAVFWPILFVLLITLVLVWAHLMKLGTFGIDLAIAPKKVPGRPLLNTMHMWFVYYLFLFCVLAALACKLHARLPGPGKIAASLIDTLAANWWGVFLLAVPMGVIGMLYPAGMLAPSGSFIPNLNELVHNGAFFVFGWALYRRREILLPQLSARCWWYAAAGVVPFFVTGGLIDAFKKDNQAIPNIELFIAYSYALAGWLWSMALIGLFVRYLPTQNRVLRYMSDSSYWVFMVHMLGTVGFGALLYPLVLAAEVKMVINIAATTLACLVSYHFLVRNTWLGVLLNGKRHSASLPSGQAALA